jgi:hypothetical protein
MSDDDPGAADDHGDDVADDPDTTEKYPVPAPDASLADTDDVDPTDPRPAGHYGRFRDDTWYYVGDDLASTVMLGPATDAEPGDDWILSFTAEGATDADRERVLVRLSPRALEELHVEARGISPDARQAGHTAECDLCGESVEFRRAVPNDRGKPVHRGCYVDAYGGPPWLDDY